MCGRSDDKSDIFQSPACLSPSYEPPTVVGRNREQRQITAALQPLTQGNPAENLLVYGPTGVGKTRTVSHACDQVVQDNRVTLVHINCWQYNTRASLLSQLLIELGYPVPRKGKPIDELLHRLCEWLNKHTDAAVVLDEFDRHHDQTAIAYDLEHVATEATNELGLVLISNQPPAEINLDPRSESRLSYRSIPFKPYNEDDLIAILQERAAKAFHADAITDEALAVIANYVTTMDGDCRHALELLHRAGRIAARNSADTVTTAHVNQSLNAQVDR